VNTSHVNVDKLRRIVCHFRNWFAPELLLKQKCATSNLERKLFSGLLNYITHYPLIPCRDTPRMWRIICISTGRNVTATKIVIAASG